MLGKRNILTRQDRPLLGDGYGYGKPQLHVGSDVHNTVAGATQSASIQEHGTCEDILYACALLDIVQGHILSSTSYYETVSALQVRDHVYRILRQRRDAVEAIRQFVYDTFEKKGALNYQHFCTKYPSLVSTLLAEEVDVIQRLFEVAYDTKQLRVASQLQRLSGKFVASQKSPVIQKEAFRYKPVPSRVVLLPGSQRNHNHSRAHKNTPGVHIQLTSLTTHAVAVPDPVQRRQMLSLSDSIRLLPLRKLVSEMLLQPELMVFIFEFLSDRDLMNTRCVSKWWKVFSLSTLSRRPCFSIDSVKSYQYSEQGWREYLVHSSHSTVSSCVSSEPHRSTDSKTETALSQWSKHLCEWYTEHPEQGFADAFLRKELLFRPHLTSLDLSAPNQLSEQTLSLILSSTTELRSLNLGQSASFSARHLKLVSRWCGLSLQSLSLEYLNYSQINPQSFVYFFERCPNLRHLSLLHSDVSRLDDSFILALNKSCLHLESFKAGSQYDTDTCSISPSALFHFCSNASNLSAIHLPPLASSRQSHNYDLAIQALVSHQKLKEFVWYFPRSSNVVCMTDQVVRAMVQNCEQLHTFELHNLFPKKDGLTELSLQYILGAATNIHTIRLSFSDKFVPKPIHGPFCTKYTSKCVTSSWNKNLQILDLFFPLSNSVFATVFRPKHCPALRHLGFHVPSPRTFKPHKWITSALKRSHTTTTSTSLSSSSGTPALKGDPKAEVSSHAGVAVAVAVGGGDDGKDEKDGGGSDKPDVDNHVVVCDTDADTHAKDSQSHLSQAQPAEQRSSSAIFESLSELSLRFPDEFVEEHDFRELGSCLQQKFEFVYSIAIEIPDFLPPSRICALLLEVQTICVVHITVRGTASRDPLAECILKYCPHIRVVAVGHTSSSSVPKVTWRGGNQKESGKA